MQATKVKTISRLTQALWDDYIFTQNQFHHLLNYIFPTSSLNMHLQNAVPNLIFLWAKCYIFIQAWTCFMSFFILLNKSWDKDKWAEAARRHTGQWVKKEEGNSSVGNCLSSGCHKEITTDWVILLPQKSSAKWKKIKYYVILLIWNIQKANLQR